MATYRETVTLHAPVKSPTFDDHGQSVTTWPLRARAAARLITQTQSANSTPPTDLTTNSKQFEIRTNEPIEIGWKIVWRSNEYRVVAVDTTEKLKARVTLAMW